MSAAAAAVPHPLPETSPRDELELVCLICTKRVPSNETVLFWRIGRSGFGVIAHVDCAAGAVPEVRS